MAVERAHAAPSLESRSPAARAREAIDLPADQMPQRVAPERVTGEQNRPVVGFAIVVAGGAEGAGENQNQKGGRKRPPRRLDQRRVERREVRSPFVVAVDPRGPCRVNAEAAEDQRRECGSDPPRVAAQCGAETAFLQVPNRSRHSVTAAIVCFTASADFFSAAFSSALSCTPTISSAPFLPCFHST